MGHFHGSPSICYGVPHSKPVSCARQHHQPQRLVLEAAVQTALLNSIMGVSYRLA